MAVEAALVPGEIGFPSEMRRHAGAAAMDLALLQGEIDFDAAWIAAHFLHLYPESFFQNVVEDRGQIGGARGAALGQFFGVGDVFNGLPRRIGSHVQHQVALIDAAQPGKFAHVKCRFFAPEQLIQVDAAARHAQRQAIRFGNTVNVIGRSQRAGARHVLHDDRRIAGKVPAHVAGEQTSILVVEAAGGEADDDANGFVFVERRRIGRGHVAVMIEPQINDAADNGAKQLADSFQYRIVIEASALSSDIRLYGNSPIALQSAALTDSSPCALGSCYEDIRRA